MKTQRPTSAHHPPTRPRDVGARAVALCLLALTYAVPSFAWVASLAPNVFGAAPRMACICRDGHQDDCPHCKKARCPACSQRVHAHPPADARRGGSDGERTRQPALSAPCICGAPVEALRTPALVAPHLLAITPGLAQPPAADARFDSAVGSRSVFDPEPPRKVPLSSITSLL